MRFPEHNKDLFCAFLSGAATPFPHIFDAMSEQILLLIVKARQLNENTEFRKWFAEQHQILTKLRARSNEIEKIYKNNNILDYFHAPRQDSLRDALIFMQPLYEGFDDGKVSLKTWGDMNRQSAEQRGHLAKQRKLSMKFIHDDLFAILTDSSAHCPPIPRRARKGYCHQDLAIAHSCSNELFSLLNDFHKIDSLPILAEAIYNLITFLLNKGIPIPNCLSEFEKVHSNFLLSERRESNVFREIKNLITNEGRVGFINRIAEQCAPQYANYLYDQYVGIYASDIIQWLYKLQMYFKYSQTTPFVWKFTTVTPDISTHSEGEEQQPTAVWESDYCQISIERDTILKLIQTSSLHDAADSLADCLLSIYDQPAQEMRRHNDTIPQISDRERCVHDTSSYHFGSVSQGNYQKYKNILNVFEKWYEKNKVFLISQKKKRTERISIEARLAGLKCYDLKMGIPDSRGMKIKDGVYDLVKQDTSIRFENTISDISLQRYHSQVKKIIEKGIDDLLLNQRNNDSRFPFGGGHHSIKPLWSKCENNEEE